MGENNERPSRSVRNRDKSPGWLNRIRRSASSHKRSRSPSLQPEPSQIRQREPLPPRNTTEIEQEQLPNEPATDAPLKTRSSSRRLSSFFPRISHSIHHPPLPTQSAPSATTIESDITAHLQIPPFPQVDENNSIVLHTSDFSLSNQDDTTNVMMADSSSNHTADSVPSSVVMKENDDPHEIIDSNGEWRPSKVPKFLNFSRERLISKFGDIVWAERCRLRDAATGVDTTWCRCPRSSTRELDRYSDIGPWANHRVRLRVPDGENDYINASPITLFSKVEVERVHRFIAMQGPKAGSTDHVWRMVWFELASPSVIVMLTNTHEGGNEKCFLYFPSKVGDSLSINEADEFGDGFKAKVRCDEVDVSADGATEVRKLVMTIEGSDEEKIIWHLLYTEWPDYGVPSPNDTGSLLSLMQLSEEKNAGPANPRIVHCSAGVGRSGTFIALEHLLEELDGGAFEFRQRDVSGTKNNHLDPVWATVNLMREQRISMVQADKQFVFIYRVLRKRWDEKYGVLPTSSSDESLPTMKSKSSTATPALSREPSIPDLEDVFI